MPFEPVPWALVIYAAFTGMRLWLALTRRLNEVVLHVSVVVDVAVLMLTIWSFHLQYQQPATVYLKAPTLLYVFILIALRAMRFEARYVLLTGLAAILGWSVLVGYAVLTAGEMQITRNFAEYATSGAILIGAEVDKIVSIAAVTGILAAAIVRARRLLVRAATETDAASQLSRFFAPEVAREIRATESGFAPGDAVMREAAILVLDLRGFTAQAARLSPAETVALLREYHREVVPEVQRHGGTIDKYLGDGIIVTFGAAFPSETHARDAFRAAEAAIDAAYSLNAARAGDGDEPIELNAAITVGPVLFGVTGDESRLEFTVIGDAVNLAAKLEKHCKVTGCSLLATATALDRARSQGLTSSDAWRRLPTQDIVGVLPRLELVGCVP
ncbi:adenylate/guanylate cyclase domain-containing protein [Aurantimonas sp. A2-1-M11]|uniref:adenylate/guanylate cyclase domain-containing protein n=1 Tax=Aurantimonas sp. A2-1-M11 TaxID=3113712 RepID=UPI002F95455C